MIVDLQTRVPIIPHLRARAKVTENQGIYCLN